MSSTMLDPSASSPLYMQAEAFLHRLIRQPRYRQGERLPDEQTLARRLSVSRGTMREAFKRLVAEGLVERRAGVGTVVVPAPVRTSLSAWPSFTREMMALGVAVATPIWRLESVKADSETAKALRVQPGRAVTFLDRMRTADGEPAVLFRSWFHPRVGDLRRMDKDRPLYEAIEELSGVTPVRSDETIRAAGADSETAQLLKISQNAPVLIRQRIVRDAGGRPFEFAVATYRADVFSYSITLDRRAR